MAQLAVGVMVDGEVTVKLLVALMELHISHCTQRRNIFDCREKHWKLTLKRLYFSQFSGYHGAYGGGWSDGGAAGAGVGDGGHGHGHDGLEQF